MKYMTRMILPGVAVILTLAAVSSQDVKDYPIRPVPFTSVAINDGFWGPRVETNVKVSIPYILQKNKETGRMNNFALAAGRAKGKFQGKRYNDSDVFKAIEAASYALNLHPDPNLDAYLDRLIDLIAAAQEKDGYLFTTRTADPKNPAPGAGEARWSLLRSSHELYNVGHLYEAAVAHYQATGKRTLLDVAVKNAELLLRVFGPDKKRDVPGHQEIEIGLAKLYRATGKKEYLGLAKFFLDERGRGLSGFFPADSPFIIYDDPVYCQDHKPVLEQEEAVGHAVRATYMYAGMADVAALGGDEKYARAIERLWQDVVGKKMFLTGGIGSRHTVEAFGDAYELPNAEAYAETCAAIGHVLWNHRLFLLRGDAKYVDVMERTIYNGLLSGVSLSGDRFFYQNPLESAGKYGRRPYFEVACCPANIARFLASFPGYIYGLREDGLFVSLFVGGKTQVKLKGSLVEVEQKTRYPWDGSVKITVAPTRPEEFSLYMRIPGWAGNSPVPGDLYKYLGGEVGKVGLKVNGRTVGLDMEKGFVRIRRTWQKGDVVELDLPMPVRRVLSHPSVEANIGRVALERGPVVYCAEGTDNGGEVSNLILEDDSALKAEHRDDLLNGVTVIVGEAAALSAGKGKSEIVKTKQKFMAIPYYAWAHRGEGEMAVWLRRK